MLIVKLKNNPKLKLGAFLICFFTTGLSFSFCLAFCNFLAFLLGSYITP